MGVLDAELGNWAFLPCHHVNFSPLNEFLTPFPNLNSSFPPPPRPQALFNLAALSSKSFRQT